MWGWTVLAGPQGLLGAGVVGWSNSGSSTLGPLCVLPPASILSTESAQGHFSSLLCLIFLNKSFWCFFSIEMNPHSAYCFVFTSPDCQPLRSSPHFISYLGRVCLGTTFILVFGSFGLLLARVLVPSSLTNLEILLQGSAPPLWSVLLPYPDFTSIKSSQPPYSQGKARRVLMTWA